MTAGTRSPPCRAGGSSAASRTSAATGWASRPRRVILTHDGRKLAGSVYLKGDEVGPLTVRLQPSGTVTGRIVDEEGRPRGGLVLSDLGGTISGPPPDRATLPVGDYNPGI